MRVSLTIAAFAMSASLIPANAIAARVYAGVSIMTAPNPYETRSISYLGDYGGTVYTEPGATPTFVAGPPMTELQVSLARPGGSGTAISSLATGTTFARATSTGGIASANTSFSDTLTFNIAGADANTVTRVHFTTRLFGNYPVGQPSNGGIVLLTVGSPSTIGFQYYGADIFHPVYFADGGLTTFSQQVIGNERRFTYSRDLIGANPVIGVGLDLQTVMGGGTSASHRAVTRVSVAPGVTYTSESGQFLQSVAGVPEPATWTMLIGGFGLVGQAARRGRRSSDALTI